MARTFQFFVAYTPSEMSYVQFDLSFRPKINRTFPLLSIYCFLSRLPLNGNEMSHEFSISSLDSNRYRNSSSTTARIEQSPEQFVETGKVDQWSTWPIYTFTNYGSGTSE